MITFPRWMEENLSRSITHAECLQGSPPGIAASRAPPLGARSTGPGGRPEPPNDGPVPPVVCRTGGRGTGCADPPPPAVMSVSQEEMLGHLTWRTSYCDGTAITALPTWHGTANTALPARHCHQN